MHGFVHDQCENFSFFRIFGFMHDQRESLRDGEVGERERADFDPTVLETAPHLLHHPIHQIRHTQAESTKIPWRVPLDD